MFRATLILLSTAVLAVLACGCGVRFSDGPHTVQTRSIGAFDRVDLRGSADVVVHRGTARTLTVEGGQRRVNDVVTRVQSGTLIVEDLNSSDTLDLSGDSLTVTVSVPRLTGVRIDGSGDLSLPELQGGPLQLRVNGSGDVNGHGYLDALNAAVDGSGDIDLSHVAVQTVKINLSGSGDANVHAVRSLAAVVSGSGDVEYSGDPQLTKDVSGSGDVSQN